MKTPKNSILQCVHRETCGSCSVIELSQEDLGAKKQQRLRQSLIEADIFAELQIPLLQPEAGFRERVDLIFENGKLGYFQKHSKSSFSVTECELLTPELLQWVLDFQKIQWPIKKGSVRLRVSPTGQRGVWLDFANLDVALLLKQEIDLLSLLKQNVVVEIGQKRKRLRFTEQGLKLKEPHAESWTETFREGQAHALNCLVGNFTQTGRWANQRMAEWVQRNLDAETSVIEFGSGVGTLTIPAAAQKRFVLACEMDELACESLKKSSQDLKIEIFQGDFQKNIFSRTESFHSFLINPPRSGMGNFAQTLKTLPTLPQNGLYVSCYLESFLKDAKELKILGYQLANVMILDQFPWTEHFEILAAFKMKSITSN
jgi:23S rRNA (uracil1939-C5)-methyltransferase